MIGELVSIGNLGFFPKNTGTTWVLSFEVELVFV
jgi:hypothetical protein